MMFPQTLPVFPLNGALLLPRGRLPLNIFEPRYVAMLMDALGSGRHIGMIQHRADDTLFSVGCMGRVSEFEETDDGRFLITLTGVARFTVQHELPLAAGGYRSVTADFGAFVHDVAPEQAITMDRSRLCVLLRSYFKARDMACEWGRMNHVSDVDLLRTLCMVCPFDVPDHQALLEARDDAARLDTFFGILERSVTDDCPCRAMHH